MARKRMFDIDIINQDSFFDLPMDAKALYFLLGMEADDEGFVSPKRVLRLYGGTEDSLRVLAAKEYIIPFKSGVIVITDWKRNNYIDKNKAKPTIYKEEKKKLMYDSENQKYISLEKVKPKFRKSLEKVNIEENSIEENRVDKNSIDNMEIINNWEEKVLCECRTREGHMCNRRAIYKINGKNYCNQHSKPIISEKLSKNKYYENEELNKTFIEFLELRKKLKVVNTERAINLLLNKLKDYDDDTKIQMLDQSIMNSWKSVYELKNKKENTPNWFSKDIESKELTENEKNEMEELLRGFE